MISNTNMNFNNNNYNHLTDDWGWFIDIEPITVIQNNIVNKSSYLFKKINKKDIHYLNKNVNTLYTIYENTTHNENENDYDDDEYEYYKNLYKNRQTTISTLSISSTNYNKLTKKSFINKTIHYIHWFLCKLLICPAFIILYGKLYKNVKSLD
jgi:hypothetical protein